jgi:hypothetical protein
LLGIRGGPDIRGELIYKRIHAAAITYTASSRRVLSLVRLPIPPLSHSEVQLFGRREKAIVKPSVEALPRLESGPGTGLA